MIVAVVGIREVARRAPADSTHVELGSQMGGRFWAFHHHSTQIPPCVFVTRFISSASFSTTIRIYSYTFIPKIISSLSNPQSSKVSFPHNLLILIQPSQYQQPTIHFYTPSPYPSPTTTPLPFHSGSTRLNHLDSHALIISKSIITHFYPNPSLNT